MWYVHERAAHERGADMSLEHTASHVVSRTEDERSDSPQMTKSERFLEGLRKKYGGATPDEILRNAHDAIELDNKRRGF